VIKTLPICCSVIHPSTDGTRSSITTHSVTNELIPDKTNRNMDSPIASGIPPYYNVTIAALLFYRFAVTIKEHEPGAKPGSLKSTCIRPTNSGGNPANTTSTGAPFNVAVTELRIQEYWPHGHASELGENTATPVVKQQRKSALWKPFQEDLRIQIRIRASIQLTSIAHSN